MYLSISFFTTDFATSFDLTDACWLYFCRNLSRCDNLLVGSSSELSAFLGSGVSELRLRSNAACSRQYDLIKVMSILVAGILGH